MRLFSILLLLLTSAVFAQPLTLTIESITSKEEQEGTATNRIFTVKYHLKNNTADTLRFFLDPKNVSPSTGGSLTKEMYYKIYEDTNFIEIGQAFTQFFSNQGDFKFDENMTQAQKDSVAIGYMAEKLEEDPAKLLKIYKEEGAAALMDPSRDYMQKIDKRVKNYYHTLLPNQTEQFQADFRWNKNRYYYMEPNEFYLNDNSKHYLELTFIALKEEFQVKVDAEVYQKIVNDPHFIKGVFVSNKVEIDFNN